MNDINGFWMRIVPSVLLVWVSFGGEMNRLHKICVGDKDCMNREKREDQGRHIIVEKKSGRERED